MAAQPLLEDTGRGRAESSGLARDLPGVPDTLPRCRDSWPSTQTLFTWVQRSLATAQAGLTHRGAFCTGSWGAGVAHVEAFAAACARVTSCPPLGTTSVWFCWALRTQHRPPQKEPKL